jgi:hypothetical protein
MPIVMDAGEDAEVIAGSLRLKSFMLLIWIPPEFSWCWSSGVGWVGSWLFYSYRP